MKVVELNADFGDRVPFRLSDSIRVSESSGCYALTNIYDDVLYIGQSENLQRRMEQHLADARMTTATQMGLPSWFYWVPVVHSELRPLESQLLLQFKATEGKLPPLNRVGP